MSLRPIPGSGVSISGRPVSLLHRGSSSGCPPRRPAQHRRPGPSHPLASPPKHAHFYKFAHRELSDARAKTTIRRSITITVRSGSLCNAASAKMAVSFRIDQWINGRDAPFDRVKTEFRRKILDQTFTSRSISPWPAYCRCFGAATFAFPSSYSASTHFTERSERTHFTSTVWCSG